MVPPSFFKIINIFLISSWFFKRRVLHSAQEEETKRKITSGIKRHQWHEIITLTSSRFKCIVTCSSLVISVSPIKSKVCSLLESQESNAASSSRKFSQSIRAWLSFSFHSSAQFHTAAQRSLNTCSYKPGGEIGFKTWRVLNKVL